MKRVKLFCVLVKMSDEVPFSSPFLSAPRTCRGDCGRAFPRAHGTLSEIRYV